MASSLRALSSWTCTLSVPDGEKLGEAGTPVLLGGAAEQQDASGAPDPGVYIESQASTTSRLPGCYECQGGGFGRAVWVPM